MQPSDRVAYGREFWMAHISNTLLLSGTGILVRYADFITVVGGNEFHLGWIVGIGMVGSFFMRIFLGAWIDRYGARPLWIGSLALFAVTCFAHLLIASPTGAAIYALRMSYCCALAGSYGASMTFVGGRASEQRLAELIGILGTAGMLGSVIGAVCGDLLLGMAEITRARVDAMFVVAGLFGVAAMPFSWVATRFESRPSRKTRTQPRPKASPADSSNQSLLAIVWRYQPGAVFVVGVAMGIGLGLPSTFLRTYADALGIQRISLFFFVYAVSAIVARVITRDWFERFGTRFLILLGTAGMVASLLLLLTVHVEWHLIVPAIAFGCSQAILYPAIVAAGAVSFPAENRGLATVLVLATWDIGVFIGSPAAGVILHYSSVVGLPPYPTMLCTIAGLLVFVDLWYAAASRKSLRIFANRKKR
jgi:MFS family permease